MKEDINLLPLDAKKIRRRRLYTSRLQSLYASVVAAVLFVGLGYLGSYVVLQWTLNDVRESLESEQGGTGDIDTRTRTVNADLEAVHGSLRDNVPWMPHVAKALNVVPAGITITNIDIRTATEEETEKSLIIDGRSEDRSAIVVFENALRELPWTDSVDSPLQNFASGPNVTFKFTITRKP